jgi:hypothetical protein
VQHQEQSQAVAIEKKDTPARRKIVSILFLHIVLPTTLLQLIVLLTMTMNRVENERNASL